MHNTGSTILPTETDTGIPGTYAQNGDGIPIFLILLDFFVDKAFAEENESVLIDGEVFLYDHVDLPTRRVVFKRALALSPTQIDEQIAK